MPMQRRFFEEGMDPHAIDVQISELLIATADGSDDLLHESIAPVLSKIRESVGMEVAFVAEFTEGRRYFRKVDSVDGIPLIGASDALEDSYCQRVVDGRMPKLVRDVKTLPAGSVPDVSVEVRSYLSTPVVLGDGSVYGTMCCFSARPAGSLSEGDLKRLEKAAELVARDIDRNGRLG